MAIVRLGSEHNTTASNKHIVIIFALKRDDDDDAAAAVAVGNVGAEFGVNDDDVDEDVDDVDFKDGRRHRRWVDVDDVAKVGLTSFTNGIGLMSFKNDVGLTSISFMYDAVDDIIIVDVIGGGDISPISGSVECDVK